VAWGIARLASDPLRRSLLVPAQVAGAVALMGPSLLVMPARGDVGRAALVMGEALVIIRYAAGRASMPLAAAALGFLGLMLYRSSGAPLVLETVSAIFGAVAIAVALSVPRWVPWRLAPGWLDVTELVAALMVLLPPLVRASIGASDALDQGSQPRAPYANAGMGDPHRPTPPADIPVTRPPLDLRAEAAEPPEREHTSVAEDMLSAAKSVFHAVLPK